MTPAGALPPLTPPLTEGETGSEIKEKLAPLYRVICHDDPITTMDFVVEILRGIFKVPHAAAVKLMMEVHTSGSAVIARYPRDTAERRVNQAKSKARARGYPLAFTIEKDD